MHPADIKAELQKCGSSCAQLAAQLDVDRSAVSHVVRGDARSRRVAFAISSIIGKPVGEIWPGEYLPKVQRKVVRKPIKRVVRSAGRKG